MKNMSGILRIFCIFHLSLVSSTSNKTHICDGYSQWIYVVTGNNFKQPLDVWRRHNITNYKSLSKALKEENLNDTCIVIQGNVNLDEDIVRWNVHKLLLTSNSSSKDENPTITCNITKYVGIAFYRTTNMTISNLNFDYCGSERLMKRECANKTCLNVSTAVLFQDNINISVSNVGLLHNIGYGMTIFDSNNIVLNYLSVRYSNVFPLYNGNINKRIPGGGLYLEYSPNYQVYNNSVYLNDYTCLGNNASRLGIESSAKSLPFGRGGAITILYLGKTTKNVFHSSGGMFIKNQAISGGVAYIYFSQDAINNTVSFNKSLFLHNEALQFGGGIYIVQEKKQNYVKFLNGNFNYNNALIGGGMFSTMDGHDVFTSEGDESDNSNGMLKCENCTFIANKAMMGSALYLQRFQVNFTNLHIERCDTRDSDLKRGHGGVYASDCLLNLYGRTNITYNKNTAVILNYSKLKVHNVTIFSHNFGYDGGGISLYGHSQIILARKSYLLFNNNMADNKGGAIYFSIRGEPSISWFSAELMMYTCFFSFSEVMEIPGNLTSYVSFKDNSVKTGFGADIYTSTLESCRQTNDLNLKEVLADWKNFNFTNKQKNSIVTAAVKMVVLPNEMYWNAYPGMLIYPNIYLKDERENDVQDHAIIKFTNNVSIEHNEGFVVGNGSNIQFRILGDGHDHDVTYNVTVTTTYGMFLSKTLQNMHLKPCPFGFKYKHRKCLCDHKNNNAKGIAECDENGLHLYSDRWVPVDINSSNSNAYMSSYHCPMGYCRPCDPDDGSSYCHYNSSNQCYSDREESSRLCSKCKPSLSVTIGGNQNCRDCTGTTNWIWISMLIIGGLSVFILLLILLQLDIMSYHIVGLLYSYQIMFSLYSPIQPVDNVLSTIMGLVEFTYQNTAYPVSCLWDGMNNIQKMAYNYIIPIWMLIFSCIVYFLSSNNRNRVFSKSKCLHAFTIVGMMIYSDLTKNSFLILDYMEIEGVKYSYIYADAKYAQGEHLPYFITAILIITVFTVCIPILLLKSILSRFRRDNFQLSRFEAELLFFLKRSHIWFLPYYFISRILIFSIGIFIQNGPFQTASVTLASLLIFIVFSLVSPYVERTENYVEILLLANLCVIGILGVGVQTVYVNEVKTKLVITIQALSYIPAAVVLLKVLYKVIHHVSSKLGENIQDLDGTQSVLLTSDENRAYQPM